MNKPLKIYLVTPYSYGDAKVRQYRYEVAIEITVKLMKYGYIVFSPIVYTHEMAKKYNLPNNYEFWQNMCEKFIDWSDKVSIVVMSGIHESKGARAELDYANSISKPVEYIFY